MAAPRLPHLLRNGLLFSALLALPVASAGADTLPDFSQLSLQELLQVRVTSVSRKAQALSSAPAAVYVVTGEEIEQLGATTLAAALRVSPGVQVARIDSHELAVSARGFNDLYSNKLLVLVDGRTIYNQLFSGVFWNQNTAFLADIDHIEIIRGPGSTQWGANAVNGVVSVSSKSAHDTQGSLLSYAGGNQLNSYLEARHGWKFNRQTAARVYLKYQDEGDYGINKTGSTTGWKAKLAGLRLDWHGASGAELTWITEARETLVGNNSSMPSFSAPYHLLRHENYRVGSWMTLLKWVQPVGDEGRLTVQSYLDRSDRSAIKFGEDRSILDFDAQLELPLSSRHDLVAGVGFREDRDRLTPTLAYNYRTSSDSARIFSTFIQDEMTLVPERLKLSAGIKFEKGSLFGWEPQPSLRAVFTLSPNQSLWASATRAARTPSRSERDMRMFHTVIPPATPGGLPTAVFLSGTPGFQTEHLNAFELGYRSRPHASLSVDASVFLNSYTHLRDINATPSGIGSQPQPHVALDSFFVNQMRGRTYGAELSARWQATSALRLDATFSHLRYDLLDRSPILPYPAAASAGTTPRYQASLHAVWNLTKTLSLGVLYSHRSALGFHDIPEYGGLDARLAWRATENLELSLTGTDLTDPRHAEFSAYFLSGPVREIARALHARATLRF